MGGRILLRKRNPEAKCVFHLRRRGGGGSRSNLCGKCVFVCTCVFTFSGALVILCVFACVCAYVPALSLDCYSTPTLGISDLYFHRWGGYPADLRHGLPIQTRDIDVQCDKHGSDKEGHAREIFEVRKQGSQILCAMG